MNTPRRGAALIYAMVAVIACVAMISFGVDAARLFSAQAEMSVSADAAARAAVAKLPNVNNAINAASEVARRNKVDGDEVNIRTGDDVTFLLWNTKTRTAQVYTGSKRNQANAIRVHVKRTDEPSRRNPIPLYFAAMIGMDTINASTYSTAMVRPAVNVNQNIKASANPFLSGMPAGSTASLNNPHGSPDRASTSSREYQSPVAASMAVNEGDEITFDIISGSARHDPNDGDSGPDGDLNDIGHNNNTPNHNNNYTPGFNNENGIADMKAPINAIVGVFLTDSAPDRTKTPANRDYSLASERNKPVYDDIQLQQTFFIGDGRTSNNTVQKFRVPQGATRLFLATWDFYEWNNNQGERNVRISRPMQITTVE